jgi:tetratricopeptide (TPR) repeat protein
VALIGLLSALEQKAQAKVELNKARQKLTDTRGKLTLAQCYEIVGENDKARDVYSDPRLAASPELAVRRALAGYHLRAGNPLEAKKHLNYLVKVAEAKEPATVVWARGVLAILAALGGRYAETREALADLERSGAQDTSAGIDGQRARAVILATRGNRPDRLKAIDILKGLIAEGRDQPPDRLLLAQLYEANNDWPQARKQLTNLLKRAGGNTAANLVAYISSLLRHGEVEEAEQALAQLEKVPDTAGTLAFVSLKAQVWHRQDRKPEAVRLLRNHAAQHEEAFGPVALVLEGLKEYRAAEEMYRKHGEKSANPSAVLALAGFFTRQKRYQEALDVCERAWEKGPPGIVANTCLGVLKAAEDNKAVQGLVERQLQAALKKDPRSIVLRHALANLRVVQRRYGEAEAIYRDLLLSEDRGAALVRNNLAWLLACQKKRIPEALTLMDEAIARAGPLPLLLDTQAQVFLEAGKIKEAIKLLEGVVAESPKDPTYHFHLAQAHLADRNRTAATRSLLQARRLGLNETTLHPLQRKGYDKMLRDLGLPRTSVE